MSIAQYIKEIGRGAAGARSLKYEQALDLMAQVLDGKTSDLEIGAFAIGMRVKGETADELLGFLDAVQARCLTIESKQPVVLLPSYNGARRLPNLTALLAMLLAQEGANVLVHGPRHDPKRVTTAEIWHALGLPVAQDALDAQHAWARHEPVFMPVDALCPPLAKLLEVRWTIGLRNSGHTVAKMLDPVRGAASLRVMNYTHPEFGTLMAQVAERCGAPMQLLRGTEGEPVADARRRPRMDLWLAGTLRPELGCAAHEGVLAEMPLLPREIDAATTARYVQAAVGGAGPVPAPIQLQVQLLIDALALAASLPSPANTPAPPLERSA